MNNPSILVVDDELLMRDLLYDFFKGQGWDTLVADSGERALDIMRSSKVDLVLTDLKMPEMDGLALTAHVQKAYPGTPVVIMTGYPSVESAVAALRSKVVDYITKPFSVNDLHKKIESYLAEEKS